MKSLKRMTLSFLVLLGSTLFVTPTYASNFETVTIVNSDFVIEPGQIQSLSLGGWYHVVKLLIQAEGYYGEGAFEVIVNGDTKGTVHVPGRDPSYIVTVGETTQTVQFRHIYGGRIHVKCVQSVQSQFGLPGSFGGGQLGLPAVNQATTLARQAIEIVNNLSPSATQQDFSTYLLPIKVVAGRAYVMGGAHGNLSQRAWDSLNNLEKQIEFASPYVQKAFQQPDTFELVVLLETLKEELKDLLK